MKKLLALFSLLAIFFSSCDRFEGDQEIPAFLKINKIELDPSSNSDLGYLTSDIRSAQVSYIDIQKNKEVIVGVFELPRSIPILAQGNEVEIRIYPVILQDLDISTQTIYPFYNYISKKVKLTPNEETVLDSVIYTTYSTGSTNIVWYENFESPSISIEGDTTINKQNNFVKTGRYSGLINFDYSDTVTLTSSEAFLLSSEQGGYGLYLEFDYWTEDILYMGIQGRSRNSETNINALNILQVPTIKDNSSPDQPEKWRKIYVSLYETWYSYFDPDYSFSVLFYAHKKEGGSYPGVYIDNIKLIHSK